MSGLVGSLFVNVITRVTASEIGKKVRMILATHPDVRAAATQLEAHPEFPALDVQLRAWVSDPSFAPIRDRIQSGRLLDVDDECLESFRKGTRFYQLGVSAEDERELVLEFLTGCRDERLQQAGGSVIISRQVDYATRRIEDIPRLVVERLTQAPIVLAQDSSMGSKDREHLVYETRVKEARTLLHKGNITGARELLLALESEVEGKDLPIRLRFLIATNLGACALADDDTTERRKQFDRALAFCPDDPKAIANRALCALLDLDLAKAEELARWALAKDSRSGTAMGVLLQALHQRGEAEELEALVASKEWMRDDLGCCAALGWIRHVQGQYAEAEKLLRTAVAGEDFNTDLRTTLVSSIIAPIEADVANVPQARWRIPEERQRRLAYAGEIQSGTIKHLEGRRQPAQLHEALLLRSHILSLGGRSKDAIVDCDRVLREVPEHPRALTLRGHLALNEESAGAAVGYLERAARAGVSDIDLPLALAYLGSSQPRRAVELLEPLLATPDHRLRVHVAESLLQAWRELGDAEGRVRALAALVALGEANAPAVATRAREAFRDGDVAECERLLRSAVAVADSTARDYVFLELGRFLQQVARHGEAADVYREVAGAPGDTVGTRLFVLALFHAGRYREAGEVAAEARGQGPPLVPMTEIEATLLDLKGDLPGARSLWASLAERFPKQPTYRIQTALLDIRGGREADARATLGRLSISDFEENAEALVRVGRARHILGMPDAVEYCYQARRVAFDEPNVHMAYVSVFLLVDTRGEIFEAPASVQPGSSVRFTAHDGDHRIVILEKGIKPRLEAERSLDDLMVQLLLGQVVGADVALRDSPYDDHRVTIREIQNQYVAAFQESLRLFETRFPTFPHIESIDAGDPNVAAVKMFAAIDARQHSMKDVVSAYRAGHVSISAFASLAGRSLHEVWSSVCADESLGVRAGTADDAQLAAAKTTLGVVCDAISLFTLQYLGLLDTLPGSAGVVYVPSAVREELGQALAQATRGPMGRGYLGKDGDRYVLVENADTIHASAVAFHEAVIDFIDSRAQVVPVEALLDLAPQKVEDGKRAFGSGFVSALVAQERKLRLYSDDFALRAYAASGLGVQGFWTDSWIRSLRERGVIDSDRFRVALVALMLANYRYPSATSEDFLWAIRHEAYEPNARVARILGYLAGPECETTSAVSIVSYLILSTWLDAVLPPRRYAILDMLLDTLVRGRSQASVLDLLGRALGQRFVLLPIQLEDVTRATRAWEKSRRGEMPPLAID